MLSRLLPSTVTSYVLVDLYSTIYFDHISLSTSPTILMSSANLLTNPSTFTSSNYTVEGTDYSSNVGAVNLNFHHVMTVNNESFATIAVTKSIFL